MRPEVHHLVSLGTLITLVLAIVGAAIAWGQVRQQVADHVEPERHAGIVLAGNADTGKKITELDTRQQTIVKDVDDVKTDVASIQSDVASIRDAGADARVERAEIKATLDQLLREVRRQNGGDP